jgi:hypothetical protein
MDSDRVLSRYSALVCRTTRLFGTLLPVGRRVPDETVALLEDAAYRLGLYTSAMPGTRAPSPQEFEDLAREIDEALGAAKR